MKRSAAASPKNRLAAWIGLCLLLAAPSCRLIADEFSWLDRAAPGATAVPDAPVPALAVRP